MKYKFILWLFIPFILFGQSNRYNRFNNFLSGDISEWIPTEGLVLLHNPGAQMISSGVAVDGNNWYPDLEYGANLVTNGDFHDFTFDNADVEDSVKAHYIFSSVYDVAEGGSGYIGQNWADGIPSLGSDLVTNGSFTVDASSWSIAGTGSYEYVTGNGFSGQALRMLAGAPNYRAYQDISQSADYIYKYTFKYRCSGNLYLYWENSSSTEHTLAANTGDALTCTIYRAYPASSYIAFYIKDTGVWVEIDDIVVQKIDCNSPLNIAGWVDYDDVKSDMSGTNHPSYENGDTLSFDGATTIFQVGQVGDVWKLNANDWTFECWVNTTGVTDYYAGFYATSQNFIKFYQNANNLLIYAYEDGVICGYVATTTNAATDNVWHHYAYVMDSSDSIYIYIDGISQAITEVNFVADTDYDDNYAFFLGGNGAGQFATCSIAEARFTKAALSANAIEASYGAGKGWTYHPTNAGTPVNQDFVQEVQLDDASTQGVGQVITVEADALYELTAREKLLNGTNYHIQIDKDIIWQLDTYYGTFANGSFANHKVYFSVPTTTAALTFAVGGNTEKFQLDDVVLRKVTNVSGVPSNLVEDYSQGGVTYGDELYTTIVNGGGAAAFDTFVSSGNDLTECANTGTDYDGFWSNKLGAMVAGEIYKVEFDYTLNSGSDDLQLFIGSGAVGTSKSKYSGNSLPMIVGNGHYIMYYEVTVSGSNWYLASQQNKVANFSFTNVSVKKVLTSGYHGVTISALEDEQPTHPYGWQYDGVADYILFGDVLDEIDYDVPFVLFIWFKWTSGMTNNWLWSKQEAAPDYTGWSLGLNNASYPNFSMCYDLSPSNYIEKKGTATPSEGWNMIYVSYDGSADVSGVKIYLNNSEISYGATVNTLSGSMENAIDLQIGGRTGANLLWEDKLGIGGIYLFDGNSGRPDSEPVDNRTTIYNNTSQYHVDD